MKVFGSCRVVLMVIEEYQYATMSAYSPTMSELPFKGGVRIQASPSHYTNVD